MTEQDKRIQEFLNEIINLRILWRTWNDQLPIKMDTNSHLLSQLIHYNFLFRYVVRLYAIIEIDRCKICNPKIKEKKGREKFSFGVWLESHNNNDCLIEVRKKYNILVRDHSESIAEIRNKLLAHNTFEPIIPKEKINKLLSFSEELENLFNEVVRKIPDVRQYWENNGTSSNFPSIKESREAKAVPDFFRNFNK